jgi:CheY-like chemotaxis protein
VKRVILYVDDNREDAQLVERALTKAELPARLCSVPDGCDAADWLAGSGTYSDRDLYPVPDLLVLDLKMPRNTGFDLMEFVKARRELEKIPIIVYTDSDDPLDKHRAFKLGANAYVCKMRGIDALLFYVRSVVKVRPRDEQWRSAYD